MAADWIVYGVRSPYAPDAAASIIRSGGGIAAYVDNVDGPGAPKDLEPLVHSSEMDDALRGLPAVIPIMTPGQRLTAFRDAQQRGVWRFESLIDTSAVVAPDLAVGHGCHVNAGSVIGACTELKEFVIVNRSASIGHHVVLEAFVSIGPGAILCGMSRVGRGAFVGAGAIVSPEVRIGENAVVGAGALVLRDVPAFSTAMGHPAEIVGTGKTGYQGRTV